MSELVIETRGLRKTYVTRRGRQVALDGHRIVEFPDSCGHRP